MRYKLVWDREEIKYRVVVYRRTGNTMQQFNSDTLDRALEIKKQNMGKQEVYKIELLVRIEVWEKE